ncbi:hypothetical protein AQUCO_01100437v1 [Aquilegia coerulea]|uniref:Galactose oxidase-like Early set domain-containing protein n=1 Tax=Aquilegia coerulea TaxID=218851 RepID=A0A2G5E731_AQUCA|nr:hypothetical protein AQUCO_01100437v1 [Aquilegia coerulea]
MAVQKPFFPLLFKCLLTTFYLLVQCFGSSNAVGGVGQGKLGKWQLLLNNTGVVAMHMALTLQNTVLIFDQTSSGPSGYTLHRSSDGRRCLGLPRSMTDPDCSAHSVEYHIGRNSIRPLRLQTDTWCSSGSILSDGTLLQTGGYGDGYRRIRYFKPCSDRRCDWNESSDSLMDNRWYASNMLLPENDSTIVMGGLRTYTYEFIPKRSSSERSFYLPFLHQTNDRDQHGNNLYPFLHLSADGNLFIFANRDSILFNYKNNTVLKTFPRIPGSGSRNYPSSGSSVILPLDYTNRYQKVEVMVCGGSTTGAYRAARRRNFLTGLSSCGRMVITGKIHRWKMEEMPGPRLLNDMLILPTGQILIINGAKEGSAGWNNAASPSLQPYLYEPTKPSGKRFSVLSSTNIPRMYHSSAILLPDGRVLVAGSNPNNRPQNVSVQYAKHGLNVVPYNEDFTVTFFLGRRPNNLVEFNVYSPPFATHAFSMNQRMLKLRSTGLVRENNGWFSAVVKAPPTPTVAPSGYYMLTVLNGGIPSTSTWVNFIHT